MNILALGGSGGMGRMAVALLLESPSATSITVASKDYERAKFLVESIGSDKLKAVEIEVTQKNKLVDLISSHDLVVNTVGPYYKYATMILKAAIEAKKPYVDICDDWKPTLEMLKMDEKAKQAGVTAIVGMGSSPGVTNLMAMIACSKLDKVDDLITAWGYGTQEGVGKKPIHYVRPREFYQKFKDMPVIANAATMHLFYETLEEIPTYRGGKLVEIKPLTNAGPLQFPGFKDIYVCHIGHPEPVTLSRVIKANSVSNLMYLGTTVTDIIREYTQQISTKEITVNEASIKFAEQVRNLGKQPGFIKQFIGFPPVLSVIATGMKSGKKMKVAIANNRVPFGGMAGITSVPLTLVVEMIFNGEIPQKGVLTPEEVIRDPMEFFDRYARYCGENLSGNDVLLIKEVEL